MKTKSLMIAIALMAIVMGMTAAADAATIKLILSATDAKGIAPADNASAPITTIAPGERFFAIAQVSDATGIAGAAFTLTYDPSKFEVIKHNTTTPTALGTTVADGEADRGLAILDSDIYGMFSDDRNGSTTSDVIRLAKVDSAAGKVMFSGAGINKANGTGPATGQTNLFRIRFRAKTGATGTGTFTLGLTALNNTAAGYSAAGETIPALMGAAATGTAAWANLTTTSDCNTSAFCTIPATFDNTAGTLTIQGASGVIVPGATRTAPNILDVRHLLYYFKFRRGFAGYDAYSTSLGNLDFNHDGKIDIFDVRHLLYYYKFINGNSVPDDYKTVE